MFRMGLHNGFDLATRVGLVRALAKLRELRPRYLHISPPCFPWSPLSHTNQRNPEQIQRMKEKRQHGRLILKNCLKLIQVQRQELDGQSGMGPDCQESHAGGEQPLRASSWKEPTVRKMMQLCGERFRCDGCQFDLRDKGTGSLIQKPWGWFSSLKGIKEALNKTCSKHDQHQHAHPTGRDLAVTAIYPQALCKTFARALMRHKQEEMERCICSASRLAAFCRQPEYVFSNGARSSHEEPDEPFSANERGPNEDTVSEEPHDLEQPVAEQPPGEPAEQEADGGSEWDPQQLMNKLKIVHANLGHPSNQVMVRMLKDARASDALIQKAMTFDCPQCRQRGHAQPHRTSQIPQASKKWDVVSVDSFWWHSPHKDEKGNPKEHVVGVSWLDEASDFHTAAIIRTGSRTQTTIKGVEFQEAFAKEWLKVLPKPGCLRFDDEGAFRDRNLLAWLEGQAIKVNVIAGEAAWQVGKHSRHLEVLKENMSLLSLELGEHVKASELLSLSIAAKNIVPINGASDRARTECIHIFSTDTTFRHKACGKPKALRRQFNVPRRPVRRSCKPTAVDVSFALQKEELGDNRSSMRDSWCTTTGKEEITLRSMRRDGMDQLEWLLSRNMGTPKGIKRRVLLFG